MVAGLLGTHTASVGDNVAVGKMAGEFGAGEDEVDAPSGGGCRTGVAQGVRVYFAEAVGVASLQQQVDAALSITWTDGIHNCA